MKKILIISGQTATGKTNFAVEMAKKYNGELVSFDSRQVYKKLNIIAGKEYTNPKTWMLDLYDLKDIVTAYDFCKKANEVIINIQKRNKLPVIIGGSAFYIKSLIEGVNGENFDIDWSTRNLLEKKSVIELQNILRNLNINILNSLNNSDLNNKRRLIRKIEILKHNAKNNIKEKKKILANDNDILFISFISDKENLKKRIEERIEKRINNGAIKEVEEILKLGYSTLSPGLNTIGYKQLINFLLNKSSFENAKLEWLQKEIDYARRQLVFLKKMKNNNFVCVDNLAEIENTKIIVYKWLYDSKS